MKWEYVGTGLALVGIGIALMLTLPPSGWPRMPPALVHIGVIFGAVLVAFGVIATIFGIWTPLPNPKFAVLGMGFSALAFMIFAAWFWVVPDKTFGLDDESPLRRMIK